MTNTTFWVIIPRNTDTVYLKDVHRRQKLTTDFPQTFCIEYFGCDYYNSVKNIILTTLPRGAYFKGLVNKIIGIVHIQKFLTTDFFLQFQIHVGLGTSFIFTK